MRSIAVRLRPGADLKGELVALAARERVQAGWVLTCVGSLSQVRVRLAGGAEHATWQGAFEIVALTGTLSPDGGHLHLAVADQQGRTVGSHLAEGCTVRTTAEVVVATDDRLLFVRARSCHRLRRAGGPRARRPVGRERHRVLAARVHTSRAYNRLMAACARDTAVGLTDSRPKTHPELRPAAATRCHSLLLAGRGYTRV
jgi:predicted DNA-binding protein with PD1-like motif